MKYNTFTELPIWKEAIEFGKEVYSLSSTGKFERDYSFKDQIRRAVISISSNIAEGFERSNNNEFVRFLLIAKGSIGEVRSQLYFSWALGYINKQTLNGLNNKFDSLAKQISSFISYLKKQKKEGKFINK